VRVFILGSCGCCAGILLGVGVLVYLFFPVLFFSFVFVVISLLFLSSSIYRFLFLPLCGGVVSIFCPVNSLLC